MTHSAQVRAAPRLPVLVLATDLLFATRISDAVRAQGGEPLLVASAEELRRGIDRWPALMLLDLHALPLEQWGDEVRRAKTSPQSRSIPVFAFGSHVQADLLHEARAAGCDHVWARSRFVAELPQIIADALNPPAIYPEGWNAAPSPRLLEGVALFNAGEYYRQHDVLEALWRDDLRPIRVLYQGVLQIGVALYQVQRGNARGALKMLRRGLGHLQALPPLCQGVDVATLRGDARHLHDALAAEEKIATPTIHIEQRLPAES